jgi:hypothetical protein
MPTPRRNSVTTGLGQAQPQQSARRRNPAGGPHYPSHPAPRSLRPAPRHGRPPRSHSAPPDQQAHWPAPPQPRTPALYDEATALTPARNPANPSIVGCGLARCSRGMSNGYPAHEQDERTVIRISAPGRGSTGKARTRWQDRSAAGSCVPSIQRSPRLSPASSLTSGCPLSAATGRSNSRALGTLRLRSRRHQLTCLECLPAQTGKASAAPRRVTSSGVVCEDGTA